MPTTVNGIGTIYFGYRNARTRTSDCRNCGRIGLLESYDTGLWFAVIFIPVIPLGQKRIIDKCPTCQWHYAANKDQFEAGREQTTMTATEQFRQHPSVETALAVHAALLGYHDHDRADTFRAVVLGDFAASADLRAGLALHMEQVGRHADAETLYNQAAAILPNLPLVRDYQARRLIFQGNLDAARELLDFQLKPGAGQSFALTALDQLASAYQQHGRHAEALELCDHLQSEYPDSAESPQFRKFVQVSERAMRSTQTILPKVRGGLLKKAKSPAMISGVKWSVAALLIGAVVFLGGYFVNQYRQQHRTLHIVNGLPEPATVQIDDRPPIVVAQREKLVLSEGKHRVNVTQPIQDKFEIKMEGTFLDRWFKPTTWVVNVGASAVLSETALVYAVNPTPPLTTLRASQKFSAIPDIDYAFRDPPQQMQVQNQGQQVVKRQLSLTQAKPDLIFQQLAPRQVEAAIAFAEVQLPFHRDDVLLLQHYSLACIRSRLAGRAEKFLNPGRSRRPIEITWHREYQDLLERLERHAELAAEYGQLLQADPGNGRLLYLCSRLESEDVKASALLLKSTEADGTLAWPWFTRANRAACAAEWNEAAIAIENARLRQFDPEALFWQIHVIRLGLGDFQGLERDYREHLKLQPGDGNALYLLSDVLVAANQPEKARQAHVQWLTALVGVQNDPTIDILRTYYRHQVGYLLGETQQHELAPLQADVSQLRVALLLSDGRPDEVISDPRLGGVFEDAWNALDLGIAFGLKGREAEANKWRQHACEILEKGTLQERMVAQMLRADTTPPLEQMRRATDTVANQMRLLAVMAQRFPQSRPEYAAEITKLNVSRTPPHHLMKKIADIEPAK